MSGFQAHSCGELGPSVHPSLCGNLWAEADDEPVCFCLRPSLFSACIFNLLFRVRLREMPSFSRPMKAVLNPADTLDCRGAQWSNNIYFQIIAGETLHRFKFHRFVLICHAGRRLEIWRELSKNIHIPFAFFNALKGAEAYVEAIFNRLYWLIDCYGLHLWSVWLALYRY